MTFFIWHKVIGKSIVMCTKSVDPRMSSALYNLYVHVWFPFMNSSRGPPQLAWGAGEEQKERRTFSMMCPTEELKGEEVKG